MDSEVALRISRLSPRERECLVLVGLGLRSKEIAPILRIDPASVDNTLKRAGKRVGVNDRRELARLLREHQPDMVQSLVQRLGQTQNQLVSPAPLGPVRSVAPTIEAASPRWGWPVPTTERQWNDLAAWQKRAWAIVIALGVLASASVLILFGRHVVLRAAAGH